MEQKYKSFGLSTVTVTDSEIEYEQAGRNDGN